MLGVCAICSEGIQQSDDADDRVLCTACASQFEDVEPTEPVLARFCHRCRAGVAEGCVTCQVCGAFPEPAPDPDVPTSTPDPGDPWWFRWAHAGSMTGVLMVTGGVLLISYRMQRIGRISLLGFAVAFAGLLAIINGIRRKKW